MTDIILFDCDDKTFVQGLNETATIIRTYIEGHKFAGGLKLVDRAIEAINCSPWDTDMEADFYCFRAECLDGLYREMDAKLARAHASFIRKQRQREGL